MEALLEAWVAPYARFDGPWCRYSNDTMHTVKIKVEYQPEAEQRKKPHIQYSMHFDMWYCQDGEREGWGRTAKLAYKDWLFETEQQ